MNIWIFSWSQTIVIVCSRNWFHVYIFWVNSVKINLFVQVLSSFDKFYYFGTKTWWSGTKSAVQVWFSVQILIKWGEYASEVQFILRRSSPPGNKTQNSPEVETTHGTRLSGMSANSTQSSTASHMHDDTKSTVPIVNVDVGQGIQERNSDVRKSLTFNGLHSNNADNNVKVKLFTYGCLERTFPVEIAFSMCLFAF